MNESKLQQRLAGQTMKTSADVDLRAMCRWGRWVVWTIGILAVAGLRPCPASAAQYTEPDVILYGKVVNVDGGSAHQLFSGQLKLVVLSPGSSAPTIRQVDLRPVGSNGEYSYRVNMPMAVAPDDDDLGVMLGVTVVPLNHELTAELDGDRLEFADPAQLRAFLISSDARGQEFQMDFVLARPELDSDGDAMADWWEDLYRLNKYQNDALMDPDGDGLTTVEEYRLGTNPQVANTQAMVMSSRFQVPVAGTGGLALKLVAQGSSPEDIYLSVSQATLGLDFQVHGTTLAEGEEFTYRDVLDGEVSVRVPRTFNSGSARLNIRDVTPEKMYSTNTPLWFEGISPLKG
ncbi:MAG: hypothetical protein ACO34E_16160, partial [Limisphaerales bacterium]